MKNMKRAERRHKKHVKFLKRLKKWVTSGETIYERFITFNGTRSARVAVGYNSRGEIIKEAFAGECHTFLRTTGRPCNCFVCSGEQKYKRTPKHKVIRDAMQE